MNHVEFVAYGNMKIVSHFTLMVEKVVSDRQKRKLGLATSNL